MRDETKARRIGSTMAAIAAMALTLALAACSADKPEPEDADAAERTTIKVLFYDENSFFMQLGNLFLMQHPEIDIEVVSQQSIYQSGNDPIEGLKALIEKEKPDVLFAGEYNFEALRDAGLMYELDALLAQDETFLEGMLPAAIDKMRSMGGGKLYGLAPTFSSEAVFYNKGLFEEYGVPLPNDGMTWDELLALAEMFPQDGPEEERVYGLEAFGNAGAWALLRFGQEQGLVYVDPVARKVTLHTESWREALETLLRIVRSDAVYSPKPMEMSMGQTYEDYLRRDLFLSGRLAMRFNHAYYLNELKQAGDRLPEAAELDWDLVTVPVRPEAPGVTTSFRLNDIFAIYSGSANVEAAWKFIRFVHSDDFARVTARAPVMGGLPVRTEYIRNDEGKNLEAFYALAPSDAMTGSELAELPQSFAERFYPMLEEVWNRLLAEELTAEEALQRMETEGQVLLDAAYEEEAARSDAAEAE